MIVGVGTARPVSKKLKCRVETLSASAKCSWLCENVARQNFKSRPNVLVCGLEDTREPGPIERKLIKPVRRRSLQVKAISRQGVGDEPRP